jgi:hypothetical protein
MKPSPMKVAGYLRRSFLRGNTICNSRWGLLFTNKKSFDRRIKAIRKFVKQNTNESDKQNASFDIYDNVESDNRIGEIPCSIRVMKLAQKEFSLR